jgi:hypothetical protein
MIIAEAVVLGLLLSLLTGGSLRGLQRHELDAEWAFLILLPLQLAWPGLSDVIAVGCDWSRVLWLLMMAALAIVLIVNSSRYWMLAIAAMGIAMNILVIGVNGGMPVSVTAAERIGWESAAVESQLGERCLHILLNEGTVLPSLADIVPIPGPRWHSEIVSVGDLLLAAGLALWVYGASRRVDA